MVGGRWNARRAFEFLRGRLSDDELVTFRGLHEASGYEFRNALETWEPERSGPASIEPPLMRSPSAGRILPSIL